MNVLECSSQVPDLNPIKHLWRDLKKSCLNLTKLERIYREEWEKLSKYRCVKAVIAAKGASTKY